MFYLIACELVDRMPLFIVTGDPCMGKTTAVMRVAEILKQRGLNVGGIISREVRKEGVRIGFEFVDINTNETASLASIGGTGPNLGKYSIDIEGCGFAVRVLRRALVNADIVICDELGPMEFKSKEFIDCVKDMLNLDKLVIAVVHKKLKYPVIDQFREKASFMINLDIQNRNKVPYLLLDRLE
ncbi:MAG: NTPase [Nitrososphaerales archaeon]|jgi:nucleoside-triphosphatase